MTDFVALDVETANEDMASICQVGLARYQGGQLVEEWSTLVDPEDDFSHMNISVHGIEPRDVIGQPTFPQIAHRLASYLTGTIAVCHTHFDRIAIQKAHTKYGLGPLAPTWLDSARVARRTWPDCAWKGYGLAKLCDKLAYTFDHHDALEDAKAAGHILLAAIKESGMGLQEWLHRVERPIDPTHSSSGRIHLDGNPEGDLYGEVLVFTGALELPRAEAAELAAKLGCEVAAGVTKKTTLLVVGDQDLQKLAGHEKSSKHRKAEDLIAAGYPIRILGEGDFKQLVALSA